MGFGFPLGLAALGALLPLAAAYFLRRRQKPRTVSALFLWRTPNQRAEAGPRIERFTRELSFLLESLAILFAALYLADLRFGKDVEQRHLVVVVDGSLSMSARPVKGKPIAERARDAAAKAISDDGAGLLTIVETGPHPRVLAGPQAEASKALAALEPWKPRQASHDYMPSLLLAKELAGPGKKIYFLTDAPPPEGMTAPSEVQWLALGVSSDNAAIVSAQRRDEGDLAMLTVRVANDSKSARRLTVSFNGPPADATKAGGAKRVETTDLAPDASAVLRVSFRNAGPIDVALPDDVLPEDGHVTLLPSPAPVVKVAVLTGLAPGDAAAVARFLAVAPGVKGDAEGALTIGPRGTQARVQLGAPGNARSFVGPFFAMKGDPLLDDVGFGGVVWTAGDNPPGRPLVTAGDAVLISEQDDGTLQLNVDLSRSNVQRTPAWPVLMGNVVRRARELDPGLPKHHLMLGEEAPVVTEAGKKFALRGPDGVERPILGAGAVRMPPLPLPGRYALLRDGDAIDELEVLAIDPRESDLRGRGEATLDAKVGGELATRALAKKRPSWPLLIVLALLLLDFWLTTRNPS